jgi:isoleucyl-tRNA synthetase
LKRRIARELVNRIQNIRKDSGFEVTDKIKVHLQKMTFGRVKPNVDYIKSETLNRRIGF